MCVSFAENTFRGMEFVRVGILKTRLRDSEGRKYRVVLVEGSIDERLSELWSADSAIGGGHSNIGGYQFIRIVRYPKHGQPEISTNASRENSIFTFARWNFDNFSFVFYLETCTRYI